MLLDGEPDALHVASDVAVPGAITRDAPALARVPLDAARFGAREALGVFFRAADGSGRLRRALVAAPESRTAAWLVHDVVDGDGAPIVTATGPAVLTLGTGELCGVFPDAESYLRFHCHEPARDAWVDLSARAYFGGMGPRTGGPVGLAYHRYRDASGAPLGAPSFERGAVYLTFTEEAPGTTGPRDNPNLLVSQWLDAEHGAFARIDFRWRGTLDSQWTHVAPESSVTLYEDAELSALKALMVQSEAGHWRVESLPLADGAFEAQLGGGSDFEVMERGICSGLRGDAVCGDRSTGAY
jgi:hypothetical protein